MGDISHHIYLDSIWMEDPKEIEVKADILPLWSCEEEGHPSHHPDVFTIIHDPQGNLYLVPYVEQTVEIVPVVQKPSVLPPVDPDDSNVCYIIKKKMEEPGNEVEIELEDFFKDSSSSLKTIVTCDGISITEESVPSSAKITSATQTYSTSDLFPKEDEDEGDRPYLCGLRSYRAKKKYTLTVHQMTHNNRLKKYGCPYDNCKYATAFTQDLRNHIARNHTKVKGYQCRKCSYAAYTSKELARHFQTHVAPKWICSFCPFKTRSPRGLRKHWERKHQNKNSSEKTEQKI